MCSLLKAKSISKLTRQKDTCGAGNLSPHTTQEQQLSQCFPEGLVTISADSFKFLAVLQHSFGPCTPLSARSCRCGSRQGPAPAALAGGVRPSLSPSTQQGQAVLLQSCSPPGQHRQKNQHVSGLVGCSPKQKWLPAQPPVPSSHLPKFRAACRHRPT